MMDSDQPRTDLIDFRCIGCGYALRGLPMEGSCPECGTAVSRSVERAGEIELPRKSIPRLKSALFLMILSTITGAPALVLYAILPLLGNHYIVDPTHQLPWIIGILVPLLFLLGALLPICTILLLPKKMRLGNGLLVAQIFAALTVVGITCMMMGTVSRSSNWLQGAPLFTLGSSLAALGCVINLTTATRMIGYVVPGWRRLGGARQSRTPLLAALAVIFLGRLLMPTSTIGLTKMQDLAVTWSNMILIGAEALMAIGAIYLLINRLWLAERLRKATRLSKKA